MVDPFVHLHNHTAHSVLDGLGRLNDVCEAAAADAEANGAEGEGAIAVTDHGTLSAAYKFAAAAKKAGVKPLMGNEIYLANGLQPGARFEQHGLEVRSDDTDLDGEAGGTGRTKTKMFEHLTVIAQNAVGWANLVRINNAAQDPAAKWGRPRADLDLLCSHAEGLIVLTGCLGGPVLGSLSRGDRPRADAVMSMLADAFDADHLFGEIMEHGIGIERQTMPALLELANRHGRRVVATNDAHFVDESHAHAHDAWLCNGIKKRIDDPTRWRFHGAGYHLRTAAEMRTIFDDHPQTADACNATLDIAASVDESVLCESRLRLPKFDVPDDYVPSDSARRKGLDGSRAYLNDQIRAGAARRYGSPLAPVVRERLQFEFETIDSMGLGDYFLIVQDVIDWARSEGIRVGPGRGSAAGCAISYCLGIVNIDPIRYNLLFERFLNPERVGMPDIDIDFDAAGRNRVFEYLARRWGIDQVARIGSFGMSLSRGSIKAAARVLGLPNIGVELSSAVPTNKNGKPSPFDEINDLNNPGGDEFRRRRALSPDHDAVADLAEQFEGVIDKEGIHACGVIVGDEPLDGILPLRFVDGFPVTQWDGKDLDALQFMKIDALALRNLDVISATERIILETTGESIDGDNPPLDPDDDDPVSAQRVRATFRLLAEGNTAGVFQLESGGITELCVNIGPNSLDDIAAIVALYRPGPLGEHMEERYHRRKNGLEGVDYGIFTSNRAEQSEIATVLDVTFGVPVYQEQLMRLGDVVAGFGPIERNRLQKAVSKKILSEMEAVGELFLAGAQTERSDADGTVTKMAFAESTANKLWDAIKAAGNYAFNASHSYAYGWVTYITAYLKANWPTAYGAALLSVTKKAEKRSEMLLSLAAEGIEVVAPHINEAMVETTVNPAGKIILGMSESRDVSVDEAAGIVAARSEGGRFTSLTDFVARCMSDGVAVRVSPVAVESLIEGGAFDEFSITPGTTCRMGMVTVLRALPHHPTTPIPDAEWGHVERARRESNRLGVLISPNPVTALRDQIANMAILGIRPTPLAHAHRLRGGDIFTTAAVVQSWGEQSGHWGRRADVLLSGRGATIRATAWDRTISELRATGNLPQIGDIVLARGKITMRAARLERDNGDEGDHQEEIAAEEHPELTIYDLKRVDLVDEIRNEEMGLDPAVYTAPWFLDRSTFAEDGQPGSDDGPASRSGDDHGPDADGDPVGDVDDLVDLDDEPDEARSAFIAHDGELDWDDPPDEDPPGGGMGAGPTEIVECDVSGDAALTSDAGADLADEMDTMAAPDDDAAGEAEDETEADNMPADRRTRMTQGWTVGDAFAASVCLVELPWTPGQPDVIVVEVDGARTAARIGGLTIGAIRLVRPEVGAFLDVYGEQSLGVSDANRPNDLDAATTLIEGRPVLIAGPGGQRETWLVPSADSKGAAAAAFAQSLAADAQPGVPPTIADFGAGATPASEPDERPVAA